MLKSGLSCFQKYGHRAKKKLGSGDTELCCGGLHFTTKNAKKNQQITFANCWPSRTLKDYLELIKKTKQT